MFFRVISGKHGAKKWLQELPLEYVGRKQPSGIKAAKDKRWCSNAKLVLEKCGLKPVALLHGCNAGKREGASRKPTLERVGRKSVFKSRPWKCAVEKWCQHMSQWVFTILRLDCGKFGAEVCLKRIWKIWRGESFQVSHRELTTPVPRAKSGNATVAGTYAFTRTFGPPILQARQFSARVALLATDLKHFAKI